MQLEQYAERIKKIERLGKELHKTQGRYESVLEQLLQQIGTDDLSKAKKQIEKDKRKLDKELADLGKQWNEWDKTWGEKIKQIG